MQRFKGFKYEVLELSHHFTKTLVSMPFNIHDGMPVISSDGVFESLNIRNETLALPLSTRIFVNILARHLLLSLILFSS